MTEADNDHAPGPRDRRVTVRTAFKRTGRGAAGLVGAIAGAIIAVTFGLLAVIFLLGSIIEAAFGDCVAPYCAGGFAEFIIALLLGFVSVGGMKLIDISLGTSLFQPVIDFMTDFFE